MPSGWILDLNVNAGLKLDQLAGVKVHQWAGGSGLWQGEQPSQ
jgi:hypothetical protein